MCAFGKARQEEKGNFMGTPVAAGVKSQWVKAHVDGDMVNPIMQLHEVIFGSEGTDLWKKTKGSHELSKGEYRYKK